MKWTNHHVRESATIYFEAFLEACCKTRVPPREAITDADAFPRLLKIREVEFSIGWLHGCAEAHGVDIERLYKVLFDQLMQQRCDEVRGKLRADVLKLESGPMRGRRRAA